MVIVDILAVCQILGSEARSAGNQLQQKIRLRVQVSQYVNVDGRKIDRCRAWERPSCDILSKACSQSNSKMMSLLVDDSPASRSLRTM